MLLLKRQWVTLTFNCSSSVGRHDPGRDLEPEFSVKFGLVHQLNNFGSHESATSLSVNEFVILVVVSVDIFKLQVHQWSKIQS